MFRLHCYGYDFTPKLSHTVLALVLIVLLSSLGVWQLRRADEKRQLLALYHARQNKPAQPLVQVLNQAKPGLYNRVSVKGHYDNHRTLFLDNRFYKHRVGYDVVTPFLIEGSDRVVLVNRGWVPAGPSRRKLPSIQSVPDLQQVEGFLYRPRKKGMRLGRKVEHSEGWPRVIEVIDFHELKLMFGKQLVPWLIWLAPGTPHGFVRVWQPVTLPPARHLGYAFQWFSLACALLFIYVVVNIRKSGRS